MGDATHIALLKHVDGHVEMESFNAQEYVILKNSRFFGS